MANVFRHFLKTYMYLVIGLPSSVMPFAFPTLANQLSEFI